MSLVKDGYVKWYKKRFLFGGWQDVNLYLYSDSNLLAFKGKVDGHPKVRICMRDVCKHFAYGEQISRNFNGIPSGADLSRVLAIRETPHRNSKPHFFLMQNEQEFHDWMSAIISTLSALKEGSQEQNPCSDQLLQYSAVPQYGGPHMPQLVGSERPNHGPILATHDVMSDQSTFPVVAIDFGTTYSGYAFSFKSKPTEIKTNKSWSKSLISIKTPTVILIDAERKFNAFGYEAEEKYKQLLEDDEAEGWALFRRFKMELYNADLSEALKIKDLSGNVEILAISAFSMSIRYLKDHALATLNARSSGKLLINESDVHFVLTVPAIWDDRARFFMREAAADAGLPNDRVNLALESEAASVWCQNIPFVASTGGDFKSVGSKYMVVDIGGGTVDIALHQKLANGKLRELHKANGGNWGGTEVDKAFVNTLRDVLGNETLKRFQDECLNDVFDLLKEFETAKRTIRPDSSNSVKIKLPQSLQIIKLEQKEDLIRSQLRKEFMKTLMSKNYGDMITVKNNQLIIDPSIAIGMFEHPVYFICKYMREILCDPDVGEINTILVVGGFSECGIVQNAIKNEFRTKTIIFPPEPGLAVLKGAVLFGHNPGIIASRKAKFTYGVRDAVKFDSSQHPLETKRIVNGVPVCTDVFKVLVKQGTEVATGHSITETKYPASDDKITKSIELYISTDPNPVLVTDPTCKQIGKMHVKLPRGRTSKEREYEITFIFGEIEIMLKVKHLKTGESFTRYFGFI